MERFNYANGRKFRPRDYVEWSDFEEVCKEYDSDLLALRDEIKGLKKTVATLVKLATIQRDYNDTFVEYLENKFAEDFK